VPALIVVLFALRGVITFCAGYSMAWVQARVINDIRQQMFDHLVHLPMTYFERYPSATLITRITNDVNNIGNAATGAGVTLVRESLTMLGLLGYLLYLNPMLTVITLLVAPFIAWVTRMISTRLRNMSRASQEGLGVMTQSLQESILCQKVLKIFGGEAQESRRFGRINDRMRGYAMRTAVAASAGSPLVHIFVSLAVATVVYMAMMQAASGAATVGSFVSFITAMLMLLAPLRSLAGINLTLQRGIAAAESVFSLLDEKAEADAGTLEVQRVEGNVTFEAVGFRYPRGETDALSDVNLHIPAGKTLALVGASGGGKTTLVNLLPRFYRATSGRILIDGVDTETMSLKSLRRQIAFVSQDVMLFDDTVAANIAYGTMADADQAAIEQAAKAAHAHDFIMAMPNGYQTNIGENGNRLSGGQRQRLAIARALLKNAAVLILDEATSALDSESERQVQQALEELMKNRTTLVIAHRLSTIERADTIAVMQHGRLMEMGDHATLLAKDGIYARLYRMQYALDQAEGS
jgi:subfamily B ATP-binding cassette protein MsbA